MSSRAFKTSPRFASGWYSTAPIDQLRAEVQAIYELLSSQLRVFRQDDSLSKLRPHANVVYWLGDTSPTDPQTGDLWFSPATSTLQAFDGTNWN